MKQRIELKKEKNYYRPTDPSFFGNVSGNSTLIGLGLTAFGGHDRLGICKRSLIC